MDLSQIFYDLFARRIAESGQYNIVEYLVYGAIMLLLAFFVIFPVLHKRGVKFDHRFMVALLPYILLGSALRVLEDMAVLPSSWNPLEPAYYLVTPGIWVLIAAVTIGALLLSKLISNRFKVSFHKPFAVIGLALALPIVTIEFLNFAAWTGFFAAIAMAAAITGILFFAFKAFKWEILENRLNILAVASQALDGSATFIATQFFLCGEQHPLSGMLLGLFPLSFVLVKVALVLVIVHYVDKEIKNENLRGFIKIVVAILGFATGLRDLLTLGVGTCSPF